MSIGWFPGHMVAARKKAGETMAITDVVLEILDARLPGASSNPMIAELREFRQKPAVKILNKSDLADPAATAAWVRAFESEGAKHPHAGEPGVKQAGGVRTKVRALAVCARRPADLAKILTLAASLAPHRGTPEKPVRMMVMGIPNVGKSTLINALVKRRVTAAGDQPALTKHQSRHELNDRMELVDTPGLMWPLIRYPSDGLMLAASHALGDNAYIDEEVAAFLGETLLARYPALLAARYGCNPAELDGPGLVAAIARRRGYLLKGGIVDYEKAGLALIHDYRSGALGRISLESPQSRAEMIARTPVRPPKSARGARRAQAEGERAGDEAAAAD
jgi:ribosome biogenesis GTPase A